MSDETRRLVDAYGVARETSPENDCRSVEARAALDLRLALMQGVIDAAAAQQQQSPRLRAAIRTLQGGSEIARREIAPHCTCGGPFGCVVHP